MKYKRNDFEPPLAVSSWGWKYHHIGIPTDYNLSDGDYMPDYKLRKTGFESSPFGIEWMKFEAGSPVHELVRRVPHIAFEVRNLDEELKKHKFNIITPPNSPGAGTRVAMIEHNGAPVELIEFSKE